METREKLVMEEKETWEKVVDRIKKCFALVKKLTEKDSAILITLAGALFTGGIWLVKTFWYFYMKGKFMYYGINSCYIEPSDMGIFFQIMLLIVGLVIWFSINYLYYYISTKEPVLFKRILKKVVLVGIECLIVFGWVLLENDIEMVDLINDFSIRSAIITLFLIYILVLTINMFAIVEIFTQKRQKVTGIMKSKKKRCFSYLSRKEKDDVQTNPLIVVRIQNECKYKKWSTRVVGMLVVIVFELALMLATGYWLAANKTEYRIILNQHEFDNISGVGFEESDNDIVAYVVVYENDEKYIVSRLINREGQNVIDRDYLNVILKEGQATYKVSNIFDFDIGISCVE